MKLPTYLSAQAALDQIIRLGDERQYLWSVQWKTYEQQQRIGQITDELARAWDERRRNVRRCRACGAPVQREESMSHLNEQNQYPLDSSMLERLQTTFTYHPPKPGQPDRYEHIRNKAYEFALMLTITCPPSRELSLALTNLEQAVMWANAAIARNE